MTKFNSATKRMLAFFLAVLTIFSGIAVSASADGDSQEVTTTTTVSAETTTVPTTTAPVVPTTLAAPTIVEIDEAETTVTLRLPTAEGFDVKLEATPTASYIDRNNGTWTFINLVYGKTYSFKAYIVKPDNTKLYSSAVTVTLKDKLATPDAPVATKVTSTTITAAKVTACEYKLVRSSDSKLIKDWSETVVFENLTPNTAYVLSVRKKGTDTKYASDPASITVKTLKAADAKAVSAPVLVDKTDKTIIVKCAPEDADKKIEFSIDKGKTWQYSGEFKNLTPNTIYGVIARKASDPAVQDPNPVSKILELRTNTKPRVEAALSNCKFSVASDKIYANEYVGVTVTGDGPDDVYLAEFGDTRYIPYQVVVNDNNKVTLVKGKGEILPGSDNANSTMTVTVIYTIERYNGGNEWVDAGTIEAKYDIEVGPEKNIFTVIGELFVTVINFFGDTLPSLILSTGGLWEKGIALLFGMFGEIGLTK